MIDGAMRHGSTLDIEGNYTDTHGQSQIGFGITRLLDYLLPRRDLIAEQYDQMIKYDMAALKARGALTPAERPGRPGKGNGPGRPADRPRRAANPDITRTRR